MHVSSSSLGQKSQREGGGSLLTLEEKEKARERVMRSGRGRTSCWLLFLLARPRTTSREEVSFFFSTSIKLQRLVELLMTRGHCWNPFSPPLFPGLTISSFRFAPDKTLSSPRQRVERRDRHGEKNSARGSKRIFVLTIQCFVIRGQRYSVWSINA